MLSCWDPGHLCAWAFHLFPLSPNPWRAELPVGWKGRSGAATAGGRGSLSLPPSSLNPAETEANSYSSSSLHMARVARSLRSLLPVSSSSRPSILRSWPDRSLLPSRLADNHVLAPNYAPSAAARGYVPEMRRRSVFDDNILRIIRSEIEYEIELHPLAKVLKTPYLSAHGSISSCANHDIVVGEWAAIDFSRFCALLLHISF